MPDALIQLGIIVVVFCLFVAVMERKRAGSRREREYRMQMMIDEWTRENPEAARAFGFDEEKGEQEK